MKTEQSVHSAATARLQQARKMHREIGNFLDQLLTVNPRREPDATIYGQTMAGLREHVTQLSQCIHEFNAYANVLYTK